MFKPMLVLSLGNCAADLLIGRVIEPLYLFHPDQNVSPNINNGWNLASTVVNSNFDETCNTSPAHVNCLFDLHKNYWEMFTIMFTFDKSW